LAYGIRVFEIAGQAIFARAACPNDLIDTVMLILVDREELISYLFYDP
jgi:hypothetical protein